MSDLHFTRQRSGWVLARAGHLAGARRRGERLSQRARRLTRDEAGVEDEASLSVVTHTRPYRTAFGGEDHRVARVVAAVLYESVRVVFAGLGLALAWALYAAWYRLVPRLGPMAMLPAGVLGGVVSAVGLGVWLAPTPWWGTWVGLNVVIAGPRLVWLVWAHGWRAVSGEARSGRARKPRLGMPVHAAEPEPAPEPEPTPEKPSPAPRLAVPVHDTDDEVDAETAAYEQAEQGDIEA